LYSVYKTYTAQINGIMVRVTEKYPLIKLVSMQISAHRKYLLK